MESGRTPAGSRRNTRARVRVAACTALAIAAGMLMSAPAAQADENPAPHRGIERPAPDAQLPRLDLPRPDVNKGAFSAQDADAPLAAPRSDVDGDGWSDIVLQGLGGTVFVDTGDAVWEPTYQDDGSQIKDVFLAAGLRDGGPVHFTLSATGVLSAYTNDLYYPSRYWGGAGWQIYNKVFSPGDLNGDGVGDILARTHAGELYLYPGRTSAASPVGSRVLVGTGWGQFDQIVGMNDVNNDGIADLFARNTAGQLYFYSGTGEATRPFKGKVLVGSGWNIFNTLFSVDDLDEDGNAELFARTYSGDLYSYSSTGTGAFHPRVKLGSGWNTVDRFANGSSVPSFGKDELIGLDTAGSLYYYYDLNNGKFSPRQRINDVGDWKGAKLQHFSSLDSDAASELFEVYDGHLYNLSAGAYDIGGGWGVFNTLVGPGDLSGDGKGDIVARDGSGTLYLYRGNGNATGFAAKQKIGTGWGQFNALIGAGDLSGDGRADLLARATDGKLYLYEGTGSAAAPFKAKKLIGSGWGSYTLAAPGDMDGDGRADLVARHSSGTLYRYDSDGKGNFKPRVSLGGGWNTYASIR
ncbi:FG-GAP repeat domain-containing protein [Streptomyces genisteinicus]|uniref:VCBS repeat-containing protein n=1 Tax=Streptomyces genisteinicus TaxID=2768068 RepID=A0A7H0I3T5_9ACTN|nr:VCBS repeat-containing protein [Streptomyces genisteinicus]QNP67451.1 VCBS repeat-containing protein [Streptomyces genisteinicus]